VRNLTRYRIVGAGTGARSYLVTHAMSGEVGYLTFSTDQFLTTSEPGVAVTAQLLNPTGSWVSGIDGAGQPRPAAVIANLPTP